MQTFTWVFLAMLLLVTIIRVGLALRQIHNVQTNRNNVPSAFADQVSLEAHQKAADYTSAKSWLDIVHTFIGVMILLAFTLFGGINALHSVWSDAIGDGLSQGMLLIASVIVISLVVETPLELYRTFKIEVDFGFNKMTARTFVVDFLKQIIVGVALGAPLLLCVLWLMSISSAAWWIYVWLIWAAFNVLVLAIFPKYIAPLFNKFSPMQDAELRTRVEQLLKKCGFKSSGIFVMDGSKRSNHGNAYFTGFGANKRIVFFDTLLSRLNHDQIEAVLAHELGHFKLHHVLKRIVWTFAMSLVFLWALAYLIQQSWFYSGLGVDYQSSAIALMLFFLVIPSFTFLLQPLLALYSRAHEFAADRYAIKYASAKNLIQALITLYKDNATTLTPDRWYSAFYDSHPPAAARIARLQQADPI
jgi:STE24 endopeptidase